MNGSPFFERKPAAPVSASTDGSRAAAASRSHHRDAAAAAVLVAQGRSRVGAALCVAMAQLALVFWFRGLGDPGTILGITLSYATFVGGIVLVLTARRRASPAVVTFALVGDLAFVFWMTATSAAPAHYERALFGAMIVIHMANFYFGRRQAWRAVTAAASGYLLLLYVASVHGQPVDRIEELWSLAVGTGGTVLVIVQAGDMRRRLRTIVALFERAEEGDFTGAYDEHADSRPDAITRVGRAYNRVRLQLASMVLTDPLTGCLNRRGFDQALAREVARSMRSGSELALLALDLDHFKLVNDTYGHLAGDEVLRAAGALLIQAARSGDVVARTGGEEFAVLLPDTGPGAAFQFASRLCDVVRAHPFRTAGGAAIRLTTSIGVAAGSPELNGDSAAVFTARADVALYAAKHSGRDRVRAWSTDLADDANAKLRAEAALATPAAAR